MPGYNTGPGQDNYGGMDGFGNPTGGNNNGTGVSPDPQPSAEDVYGISPHLGVAEEAQRDRFSPDRNNTGLQSIVDVYSKYSPTALALRALGFLGDTIEGFFGYEGPDAEPTSNPNNQNGGGGPLPLLTDLPVQALDPDQEFIDNLTDPYQIRIAEMMEGQDYTPEQIREYIEATSSDVGLV